MLRIACVLLSGMLLTAACSRQPLASNIHRDAVAPADTPSTEDEIAGPMYRESTLHFVEISASGAEACGITTDASIECWGSAGECRDQEGECSAAYGCRVKPTSGTWKHVSVDMGNGCAIDAANSLTCWGCPIGLGPAHLDGPFSAVHIPYASRVEDGSLVALVGAPSPPDGSIAAWDGVAYYCGVRPDQSLVCWGSLGNVFDAAGTPPSGSFVQVAGGTGFECALRIDGQVICWGVTNWDSGSTRFVPFPGGTYIQIDADGGAACGVRSDGSLACWAVVGEYPPPPEGQYFQVAVGGSFFCALRTDGIAVCWGENTYGESSPP